MAAGTDGSYARPPGPRVEAARGVTDGSGNVTFTWPPGAFAAPPVVTIGLQGAAGFRVHSITGNTAAATTVNVQASTGVTLLGIGVLAVGGPAAGVTVHAHAVAAP
ncbi:hypothetical protein [Streptomyces sp. CCM_MD2014]|uniref:hypothetical protein n=1 Tax=Streptomyces sp. CCM_MD2014 TaxID=1561022 RepID=UPI00052A1631|nr:hypothetical protein [Streptomyces sp. CCM_MD2014]AIV35617.1 hypothetical protein NI25_20695 [Streptomyces sp. CCM_MD2014]